jgi:hypothetical protein
MEQVGVLMQSFSEAKTKMHNAQCIWEEDKRWREKYQSGSHSCTALCIKGAVKM